MTLADSGCPPESVRVSQSQPESARVSHSRAESARVCQSWQESAWVSQRLPGSVRSSNRQPDSARVRHSQPELARVIKRQPELARVSQSQPESARVGQSFRYVFGSFGLLGAPVGPKKIFVWRTCAKLILWPKNCQMKHLFIIMVTFQNRSQKSFKLHQNITSFRHNMFNSEIRRP
jgi:hypothetical protein